MKNSKLYTIVAVEKNNGIGKDGVMPWWFKKEMHHFTKTTTETLDPNKINVVLMGKTTWESLPKSHQPLPDRKNVVLVFEKNPNIPVDQYTSFEEAITALKNDENVENIYISGGASIYRYAVENLDLDGLYITRIDKDYDCDTFFPEVPEKYNKVTSLGHEEEDGVKFEFLLYEPSDSENYSIV